MKTVYTFLVVLLFTSVLSLDGFAQSFYTGTIGVTQSNGGRTRVYSDNLTTRQFERISILVGVSTSAVFDYNEDQDVLINAATVTSPLLSDFEVTSTINNSYSGLPPVVQASYNIYGWNNGAYLLFKATVKNNEAAAINAVIGLEAIPRVNGTYENDTLQWDAASQTVLFHKNAYAGIKFLSSQQKSLELVEWTDPYANDSLYYVWLTQNSFDPLLIANAAGDGAVAVLGQDPVTINPGDSVVFYYGISIGSDKVNCLSNMDLCVAKYNQILPVELTSFTGTLIDNKVNLKWQTATELNNLGFEIEKKTRDNSEWVRIGFSEGKGTTTDVHDYSFIDDITSSKAEKLYYRLKQIDFNGKFAYSNEIEIYSNLVPDNIVLDQNYPNPFNPSTKISFGLPQKSNVILRVFNALGEQVAELVSETLEAGTHSYNFDASNLTSGVYIYSLQTNAGVVSNKMTLLK